MNTYQLFKEDNITYVSLEPLLNDVRDALVKMKDIKTDDLDDTTKHQLNLKILGLESIYTFVGGLITEQNLNELREKYNGETSDTTIIH